MRYVLILLGLLVANAASAIDCQKLPSCEELGYSKEEVKGCAADGYVYCPFDDAYKTCVNYDCATLGFTESDKTSWCASIISCKSNSAMTLCQKPCIATTYDELKDLASSGECKVVTMRNDITIPENQGITLHADTIIDGGGHTLTSSGNIKSLIVFSMNNKTGMKNLKLHHTQTETQEGFNLLKAETNTDNISLENIEISATSNDPIDHWAPILQNGVYDIRGKFALDMDGKVHFIGFDNTTAHFSDAQVSLKIIGKSGDMFVRANVTFTNSFLDADAGGANFTHNGSATFINSQVNLKGYGLSFGYSGENQKIVLEKSSLTTSASNHVSYGFLTSIVLKGTIDHPSVLTFNGNTGDQSNGKTSIESTNTAATLIYNGTTYRPKQIGTTLLSQVESSENWEKVSQ